MFVFKIKAALSSVLILSFVATGATILTCHTAAGQGDKKPPTGKAEPAVKQEKDKGVKQPEAKADEFVWGKALDKPAAYAGLQVGIGVSPKDKRTYKAGESVKVTLKARNAGKIPITISYYEKVPLFGLVVDDEKGKRVKLLGGVRPEDSPQDLQIVGVGKAPWREQSLKPGEEIEFGSQQLSFVSPKGNLNSWPRLLVSNPAIPAVPGKYKLSYVDVCLNMPKASHNLGGITVRHDPVVASTGQMEIEIKAEQPKESKKE
jgi:hypothetical protein